MSLVLEEAIKETSTSQNRAKNANTGQAGSLIPSTGMFTSPEPEEHNDEGFTQQSLLQATNMTTAQLSTKQLH